MNERKVFGDVVKNPEAVSRGKQRARALEASGLEYLKGHGPGYKAKVAANFTRIEVAGGEPEDREDYRFVVDQDKMSLYRLHVPSGSSGSFLTVAKQNHAQYGRFLAGPLIDLAPDIGAVLAPGGRLILAGLLDHQAARVEAAYRREGLMPLGLVTRNEWPTLVMRKRRR